MARLILRYRGAGSPPEGDLASILATPEIRVVDQTSRMLLVEGDEDHLRSAINDMADWLIAPERSIAQPDPRPTIAKR